MRRHGIARFRRRIAPYALGGGLVFAFLVAVIIAFVITYGGGTKNDGTLTAIPTNEALPTAIPEPTLIPADTTPTPPSQLPPPVRPKAGKYRYTLQSGDESKNSALVITDDGGGRQFEIVDDLTRNNVEWRADGKYSLDTTFGAPYSGAKCDWDPDLRELAFPMSFEGKWEFHGSCSLIPGVDTEVKGVGRIGSVRRFYIDGVYVDTWLLRSDQTVTYRTSEKTFVQKIRSERYFAPAYGLFVKASDRTTGKDPKYNVDIDSTVTREIKSMTPA